MCCVGLLVDVFGRMEGDRWTVRGELQCNSVVYYFIFVWTVNIFHFSLFLFSIPKNELLYDIYSTQYDWLKQYTYSEAKLSPEWTA